MTDNRKLIEWLDALLAKRETNSAAVADAAGINKATITKWRGGQRPSPADLRAVANALNAPVLAAFLAAGYLAPTDTKRIVEVDRPLSDRTDDELIAEVLRRMRGESHGMEGQTQSDAQTEGRQNQEVESPDRVDTFDLQNAQGRDRPYGRRTTHGRVPGQKPGEDRAEQAN